MGWNDEQIEALKTMWAGGSTASEIGKALEKTRNAILGKAHRLDLASRDPRIVVRAKKPTYKPKSKPVPVESIMLPALILAGGLHATVETINDAMCHWPIGDPLNDNFHFCGNSLYSTVYCAAHAQIAYQPKKTYVKPHIGKLR